MQSFRTELENPVVEQDIIDLERKIKKYRKGEMDEDRFRSLRLARGVYGQRQSGVQMVRIKIPFGRLNARQLNRISDLSDEYSNGNLHATTRQDIQIHYVSLDRTPELWARLEEERVTLREACGNTVRNVTASALAGIDPDEPFDVSVHANEVFEYFLRNPVCQEMGRKFKIAFSSSDKDSAFTFIHDLGFIPRRNEKGERGFKVLVGGGLGAQPKLAETAVEFLPENQLIPFTEATLRVFDRHGERNKRGKARMKFLLKNVGLAGLLELIEGEQKALAHPLYPINYRPVLPQNLAATTGTNNRSPQPSDPEKYSRWQATNLIAQKQPGYYAVAIKLPLGNMNSSQARRLAGIIQQYTADDCRITVNQGYLLRFVPEQNVLPVFEALNPLGFAEPGFDSVADITACPGTDTCNLGISNSTGVSLALEKVIREEYAELVNNQDIKIKISGCPNSCGQHSLAAIGLHGSSIKDEKKQVIPALQVLLGGGISGGGMGIIAEKVIKIPSKRIKQALRLILNDYYEHAHEGEYFSDYYARTGRKYFYQLLKPLTRLDKIEHEEYTDWGHESGSFQVEAGTGECAGVIVDLVSTLFFEVEEKLLWAEKSLEGQQYADSIYHSYSSMVWAAKALLLTHDINPSSHMQVIREFDEQFAGIKGLNDADTPFHKLIMQINRNAPEKAFAEKYREEAGNFYRNVQHYRNQTQP